MDASEFNGRRLYIGLRLNYRLKLWAPTSTSRAISAVAELIVVLVIIPSFFMLCSATVYMVNKYDCYIHQ